MKDEFVHEDDLKPENIEGNINYYAVECWSNDKIPTKDGMAHDVHTAAIYTTFKGAADFCRRHPHYAGRDNDWHWRISRGLLNEDSSDTVGPRNDVWIFDKDMLDLDEVEDPNFEVKQNIKERIEEVEGILEELSLELEEF